MKNDDKRSKAKTKKRANPCEPDEFRGRGLKIYMVKGEDWRRNGKGRGLEAIFGFQQKKLAKSRFANRMISKSQQEIAFPET